MYDLKETNKSRGCAGVEHQNSILVADDAVTFAQRVLEVLADPFCFAGQAGRARHVIADYYTWDRIGRKLLGHLDALIKAG